LGEINSFTVKVSRYANVVSHELARLGRVRGCLVPSHILPNQSVASHKSVAAIKSVAKKLEAKLW
jgi:hypothetical protein